MTQGKNFDRSGAIGPWMVTADEVEYLESVVELFGFTPDQFRRIKAARYKLINDWRMEA